ncbi:HipA kinase-like C-terminal domain-containing protein [Desulfonema limicola]|uniref:HipA kinase-like C-terminal domain-containing protein n=1 Tax=Desulfonema limicola TaxID=45656 RepID=A0A975B6Y2_9BACT|nr:HipA domain-containing protein [Desulfonema limicola]QTA79984.1 HipA kinase-like C-terminal domain-containing protein [Desulfonema limicola]
MKFNKNITKSKLRTETTKNFSGNLNEINIPILREKNYYVIEDYQLDGDAPKQFIMVYSYQPKSKIRRMKPKTWTPYIAKTAEKWYPHESVIEYAINRIGYCLELRMNEVKLLKINNQIRFLSQYFLNKDEMLYHGADICGEYLEDKQFAKKVADCQKTARDFFTYEFVVESIKSVFQKHSSQLISDLVKILTFDAIVGNNDRHFYNWAVVTYKKRCPKKPFISPIYDTARGLMWNESDQKIINLTMHHNFDQKINDYISNSRPRISIDANKNANHFELISFIKDQSSEFRDMINQIASDRNEAQVYEMLKKEIFPLFIEERRKIILSILKKRFNEVRSV